MSFGRRPDPSRLAQQQRTIEAAKQKKIAELQKQGIEQKVAEFSVRQNVPVQQAQQFIQAGYTQVPRSGGGSLSRTASNIILGRSAYNPGQTNSNVFREVETARLNEALSKGQISAQDYLSRLNTIKQTTQAKEISESERRAYTSTISARSAAAKAEEQRQLALEQQKKESKTQQIITHQAERDKVTESVRAAGFDPANLQTATPRFVDKETTNETQREFARQQVAIPVSQPGGILLTEQQTVLGKPPKTASQIQLDDISNAMGIPLTASQIPKVQPTIEDDIDADFIGPAQPQKQQESIKLIGSISQVINQTEQKAPLIGYGPSKSTSKLIPPLVPPVMASLTSLPAFATTATPTLQAIADIRTTVSTAKEAGAKEITIDVFSEGKKSTKVIPIDIAETEINKEYQRLSETGGEISFAYDVELQPEGKKGQNYFNFATLVKDPGFFIQQVGQGVYRGGENLVNILTAFPEGVRREATGDTTGLVIDKSQPEIFPGVPNPFVKEKTPGMMYFEQQVAPKLHETGTEKLITGRAHEFTPQDIGSLGFDLALFAVPVPGSKAIRGTFGKVQTQLLKQTARKEVSKLPGLEGMKIGVEGATPEQVLVSLGTEPRGQVKTDVTLGFKKAQQLQAELTSLETRKLKLETQFLTKNQKLLDEGDDLLKIQQRTPQQTQRLKEIEQALNTGQNQKLQTNINRINAEIQITEKAIDKALVTGPIPESPKPNVELLLFTKGKQGPSVTLFTQTETPLLGGIIGSTKNPTGIIVRSTRSIGSAESGLALQRAANRLLINPNIGKDPAQFLALQQLVKADILRPQGLGLTYRLSEFQKFRPEFGQYIKTGDVPFEQSIMGKDYYKILGLQKGASVKDITKRTKSLFTEGQKAYTKIDDTPLEQYRNITGQSGKDLFFHGTSKQSVEKILSEGFDFSLAGKRTGKSFGVTQKEASEFVGPESVWLAADKNFANLYGSNILRVKVKPTAKIFDVQQSGLTNLTRKQLIETAKKQGADIILDTRKISPNIPIEKSAIQVLNPKVIEAIGKEQSIQQLLGEKLASKSAVLSQMRQVEEAYTILTNKDLARLTGFPKPSKNIALFEGKIETPRGAPAKKGKIRIRDETGNLVERAYGSRLYEQLGLGKGERGAKRLRKLFEGKFGLGGGGKTTKGGAGGTGKAKNILDDPEKITKNFAKELFQPTKKEDFIGPAVIVDATLGSGKFYGEAYADPTLFSETKGIIIKDIDVTKAPKETTKGKIKYIDPTMLSDKFIEDEFEKLTQQKRKRTDESILYLFEPMSKAVGKQFFTEKPGLLIPKMDVRPTEKISTNMGNMLDIKVETKGKMDQLPIVEAMISGALTPKEKQGQILKGGLVVIPKSIQVPIADQITREGLIQVPKLGTKLDVPGLPVIPFRGDIPVGGPPTFPGGGLPYFPFGAGFDFPSGGKKFYRKLPMLYDVNPNEILGFYDFGGSGIAYGSDVYRRIGYERAVSRNRKQRKTKQIFAEFEKDFEMPFQDEL